jgi:hypothetical protein
MRQARFVMWRPQWLTRVAPFCALALAGWGCQQPPCYYYYGCGIPPCAPGVPVASPVPSGPVCEVPTQVIDGATNASDGSGRATVVRGSQRFPRVVMSEPADPPRSSWRRPNPDEPPPTTSVEGALGDSSVNR